MKKFIIIATTAAMLSSCGIYTKYKPAETVPDSLYGEKIEVADTLNFGNSDWKEVFTDPHLQTLIEQALQNNTDYQSAQLRIEESRLSVCAIENRRVESYSPCF